MENVQTMAAMPAMALAECGWTRQEALERFTRWLQLAPATRDTYRKALRAFFAWLDNYGIETPTAGDLREYRNMLIAEKESGTANVYINAVKRFYEFIEENGGMNIAARLKGAKASKTHKKGALSVEQVQSLYKCHDGATALEDLRNAALIRLLINCGLRTVEVERANIEDIKAINGQTVLYLQGKGHESKDDFVVLPQSVIKAIAAYLELRKPASKKETLFASVSNRNGNGRMTTRSIRRIVTEMYKQCGIDDESITAHSTRHTAITFALLQGVGLQEVQQFARHTNINTTMIYAHNLNKLNGTAASAIERLVAC